MSSFPKKRSAESPCNNSETPAKKAKTEEPAKAAETKVPISVCKDSVKQLLRNTSGDIKKINDAMNEILKKYSWLSKNGYMLRKENATQKQISEGYPLEPFVNASRKLIHTGVFLGKDSKPMRVVAVFDEFDRPYFVRPVFKKTKRCYPLPGALPWSWATEHQVTDPYMFVLGQDCGNEYLLTLNDGTTIAMETDPCRRYALKKLAYEYVWDQCTNKKTMEEALTVEDPIQDAAKPTEESVEEESGGEGSGSEGSGSEGSGDEGSGRRVWR